MLLDQAVLDHQVQLHCYSFEVVITRGKLCKTSQLAHDLNSAETALLISHFLIYFLFGIPQYLCQSSLPISLPIITTYDDYVVHAPCETRYLVCECV